MRRGRSGGRALLPRSFWLLPLLACTCGCGSSKISGKVTYKGQPLNGGIVVFTSANGWSGNAAIAEDGTYNISKVPKGSAKVTVTGLGEGRKPPRSKKAQRRPQVEGAPQVDQGRTSVTIPPQYQDLDKTPLKLEVTGGSQTYNIPLDD